MRSINRRGARISKDVALIEGFLRQGLRSPNAEAYVRDGDALMAELAESVHTGTDPGREVETESRDFLRRTRERFMPTRIGQAARREGLSSDEAAQAMVTGRFDPFAD
jgi:hypothetical protein